MRLRRLGVGLALAATMGMAAYAQTPDNAAIAPLPESSMDRIAPANADDNNGMLTTHKAPAALPWAAPDGGAAPAAAPAPSPFGTVKASAQYAPSGAVPFGHVAPEPVIPSGPHTAAAVPVENVDAIEASEPAPPTPVAPGADPVKEDPAQPTEFTSPIFDATTDSGAPRKIIFRVLNKVTAQSAKLEAKPGDTVKFGQLEITAVMCRTSQPTSQRDDAGLFDISEHMPGSRTLKPVFHGWMYASSASITALEHPIYDVTMVECAIAAPAGKAVDKTQKKKK